MKDCLFCKIVKGEIESAKIWESKEFLAVLDINPNTIGMTLVLTKKHYDSYAFNMPDNVYKRFLSAVKKVAKLLDKKLNVERTAMVMEGMGVNHAHIKLYPLHGLDKRFEETWFHQRVFFEKYKGYTTTQLGPKANMEELQKLAEKIKK